MTDEFWLSYSDEQADRALRARLALIRSRIVAPAPDEPEIPLAHIAPQPWPYFDAAMILASVGVVAMLAVVVWGVVW